MDEFLQGDDFRRYRKKQIEAIVGKVGTLPLDNGPEFTRGMLDMARILIRLPEELANGDAPLRIVIPSE